MKLVLAAVLLALLTPAPSYAGGPALDVTDPVGDVRDLSTSAPVPDVTQRHSIDVRRFTVTPRQHTVRFAWTLAAVTTSAEFDQILLFQFAGPDSAGWVMEGRVVVQRPERSRVQYAPTLDGDDSVRCTPRVSVRGSTVRVDVPLRCVPDGRGRLGSGAYVVARGAGGEAAAVDGVAVPGRHTVR